MSSATSNTITVKFYDGRAPVARPATLIWLGSTVKVIGATLTQSYPTDRLRVSPRVGKAERFIALPDGAQLQCADHPLLYRLPQEGKTEGAVAWLEQRWPVALVSLAVTVIGLTLGYVYGLPAAADRIAARVPIAYERKLGEQAINWLDENKLFQPSALAPAAREEIAAGFAKLTQDLPLAPYYRLEFRHAPTIGPNAFALPGGIVVMTDEMIERSESVEEALAVLAHEIGHVERRHALRHVLQSSATAALAATVTSDASSLTLAVSGLPVLLAQTKYSRAFEIEADEFGFVLLKRHGLSPEHFASLMQRLSTDRNETDERKWSFVSTHPVTAERIARARAAAQD